MARAQGLEVVSIRVGGPTGQAGVPLVRSLILNVWSPDQSISGTLELVRKANPQTPSQTDYIRNVGQGPKMCFEKPSG